ncbi:TonB-dependent receptor [Algoriphagus aquimarinus]|uniref:SusC/RagA family TonB-linked outer membrane protein n=1 Tax=Algoriphagus aquimarinus TaxID=237018 RepID=UPI0030D95B20|tara:strand:- start:99083 stop:102328 length:3246 start_codon:yes stop_codon:yes gene_type:complete
MKNSTTKILNRLSKWPDTKLRIGKLAHICLLFLFLGSSGISFAQQGAKTVTGTVTDNDGGMPLPGLTILVKGTTNGTISDVDGKYSIQVRGASAVLVFSYIGYEQQEITVGNKSRIDVVMSGDISSLNEVVVVGYGTQKRGNLTGAVGITDSKVLDNRPITNLSQGLQGVVPGLNIASNNGTPGSGSSINIRGATSINGGSPLVLVDGAQMDINNINPQDIESVTVLKDAASAAIYGARAAFGVILVTTKKGDKNSKPKVTYSGNFYASSPTIIPNKADSYKYALYINSMRQNAGQSIIFDDVNLGLIKDRVEGRIDTDYSLTPSGTSYYMHANNNWADQVFADAAPGQNHNLSVSGGSDKTAYRASFAYAKENGIVTLGDDFYERFNFNTNLSTQINSWLKTSFQVNFARAEQDLHNLPGGGFGPSIFHVTWRARPTEVPYYDIDGVPVQSFSRLNPVATIENGGRDNSVNYNLNTKAGVEMNWGDFSVLSNFTFNPKFNNRQQNHKQFYSVSPAANFNINKDAEASYIDKVNQVNTYYAFDMYGKYAHDWASGHSVQATLGYNQEMATFTTNSAYNSLLISDDILSISNTLGEPIVTDDYYDWALRSVFARVNYSYQDKYLLEVNGRYDGSSRFNKNDRFGFFPSVSAGWRISDEGFLQEATWINLLKVRASYGQLGNQNATPYYPFVGYTTVTQTNWISDGTRPLGLSPQDPIGANRTWETVATTNFGVDMMFLRGRLDIAFDIFQRNTTDMLVPGAALPATFGAAAPQRNAADLQVKGWESSIGWNDEITKDLTYNVNFVISDSKAEITKYDNPSNTLSSAYYVGKTIGEIWGYETVGIFQSQEGITNAADHTFFGPNSQLAPGDIQYADLNGDGEINTGSNTVEDPGDRRIIGNASPRYNYGIRAGLQYKGFDLSVFFQGIAKRDFWLDGPIMFGGSGYGNAILTDELYNNTWSDGSDGLPVNTDSYYYRPSQLSRNSQVQTRYLQDASYLRLKNLTVGYNLPAGLMDKWKMTNARVFVSAENLVTFTKLNKNFDPEVLDPGQDNLGGTNFSNGGSQSGKIYPLSKRLSFGLTIGF